MANAVSLSSFWSDGAVVQRDKPLPLCGTAAPGAKILVSFAGQEKKAVAAKDGSFELVFDPLPAGGPHELLVDGERVASDIFAGELWFAAGQSNMELPLGRTERWPGDGKHLSGSPLVRVLRGLVSPSFEGPAATWTGARWYNAADADRASLPALSYHFAAMLHENLGVAVGVINVAVGGSPIRAWLPPSVCEGIPAYRDELRNTPGPEERAGIVAEDQTRAARWNSALDVRDLIQCEGRDAAAWKPCQLPASWADCGAGHEPGSVWFRKTIVLPEDFDGGAARLSLGGIIDSDKTWVNDTLVGSTPYQYPPRRYDVPAGVLRPGPNTILVRSIAPQGGGAFLRGRNLRIECRDRIIDLAGAWEYARGADMPELPFWTFFQYHAGGLHDGHSAPFAGLPIAGALWYQGESDAGAPARYLADLELLVAAWRSLFKRSDLPVLAVQLPEFGPLSPVCVESGWAAIRDAQRRALSIPDYHLAVTLGLGQWHELHPPLKAPIARRLVLLARKYVYGENNLLADPPVPEVAEKGEDFILIRFAHAGTGLETTDGLPPAFFSLEGPDGRWQPVPARIEGASVRLLAGPGSWKRLRYAWAESPEGANLANSAGLPASPFELTLG